MAPERDSLREFHKGIRERRIKVQWKCSCFWAGWGERRRHGKVRWTRAYTNPSGQTEDISTPHMRSMARKSPRERSTRSHSWLESSNQSKAGLNLGSMNSRILLSALKRDSPSITSNRLACDRSLPFLCSITFDITSKIPLSVLCWIGWVQLSTQGKGKQVSHRVRHKARPAGVSGPGSYCYPWSWDCLSGIQLVRRNPCTKQRHQEEGRSKKSFNSSKDFGMETLS